MVSRIFTLILLLVALNASAQRDAAQRSAAQRDLIITQAGEQIRCRIIDESSMRFSYIYVNEKGKQVKSEIFKTLISSFKYNYFPEDAAAPGKKTDHAPAVTEIAPTEVTGAAKKSDGNEPAGKAPAAEKAPGKVATEKTSAAGKVSGKVAAEKTPEAEKASGKVALEKTPGKVAAENPAAVVKERVAEEKEPATEEYVSPLKGKTEFTNYLKYRIGFKGGLGNIIDDNTDKSPFGLFNEKLRRGWIYGVDAAVFLNDHVGLGITYQSYQSRNKNANLNSEVPLESGGSLPIRSLESKLNHKFVGPTLLGRIGMDYKTFIVATVSPGYHFYSDKGMVNQMNYEYKGGTWGGAATLGIDFLMGNNETGRDVILSFECGYNYGQLKNLNPANGWNKLPIGMNRLDFAVGLRFTRFPRYLR